jgi:hypothetical protein
MVIFDIYSLEDDKRGFDCGQEIYFDANNKSQSGKFIPLDKDTGLPRQCQ